MRALLLALFGWTLCSAYSSYAMQTNKVFKAGASQLGSATQQSRGHRTAMRLQSAASWCQRRQQSSTIWQTVSTAEQLVLGKPDVHTCSVIKAPPAGQTNLAYIATQLVAPDVPGLQLFDVLLLDCDANHWQLSGIQDLEHMCLANTAALRAACNQWLLSTPQADDRQSHSCAAPGTAFARSADLQGRVLVLQSHWRLSPELAGLAVKMPQLTIKLGAVPEAAVAAPIAADKHAGVPALLGSFVGSGVYQPSSLFHRFPALSIPGGLQDTTASLMCGKRCTFKPLGRSSPRPVTVVGVSFKTFDRATNVAVEIQRGWAGKRLGPAVMQQTAQQSGVMALEQPLQLMPGDVVKWRCTYNTSDIPSSSSLQGGFSASSSSQQEQCTVVLHYWPRVESMRGCLAAPVDDMLRGENMCSSEAEDLLEVQQDDQQQFPMRRMYNERSFPTAAWMGAWKATHIVLESLVILAVLWGSQTLLARCRALDSWRRRFLQLHPGQQRNVSVYIAHLLLDTVCLLLVSRPMVELWLGLSETTADVRAGSYAFTYIVAMYLLELTWRRSVDAMLAVHHIGTISIILVYAGELTPYTYRAANNLIVLAAFAIMEQPTYVALLLKRMLPASSPHVHRSARVAYISWFALKLLSVFIGSRMFVEDWHLMPNWLRMNFIITWLVAVVVQGWSGFIQYGIYTQAVRSYKAALAWQTQQSQLKAALIGIRGGDSSFDGDDPGSSSPLNTPSGSDGSEDCVAQVGGGDIMLGGINAFSNGDGVTTALTEAAVRRLSASAKAHLELSPSSSGSLGAANPTLEGNEPVEDHHHHHHHGLPSRGSRAGGSGKHVRLLVHNQPQQQQGPAGGLVTTTSGTSGTGSDDSAAGAGSSSGARVLHHGNGTLQRRSKSGLLNLMECGLGSTSVAGQES